GRRPCSARWRTSTSGTATCRGTSAGTGWRRTSWTRSGAGCGKADSARCKGVVAPGPPLRITSSGVRSRDPRRGGAGRHPDPGVRDGRIAAVGALAGAEAAATIDATGRYLLPGFVDTHCHAESAVFDPTVQQALLRQGVTTVLLGQDGLSYAPGSPSTVDF